MLSNSVYEVSPQSIFNSSSSDMASRTGFLGSFIYGSWIFLGISAFGLKRS